MTDVSTWRREAPSVRSVANSRVRCAIVIESEFAITKAPTNSAMPPKTSRNVRRKEMNSFVSDASSCACASPVRTCVAGGRIFWISATSASGATPSFAATRIWSSLPGLAKRCCAVGRLNPARVAPPIEETVPNLTKPEMRSCSVGPSAWTPIFWPICRSFLPAVDSSITTSPSAGQRPSTSARLLSDGCVGSTLKPRFGAPPKTIAFPSEPISCASPPTPPTAAPVSGSAFTSASSDSSNGGATVPLSPTSNAVLPVIVASVPR